jgi:hypothetical protein
MAVAIAAFEGVFDGAADGGGTAWSGDRSLNWAVWPRVSDTMPVTPVAR